MQQSVDVRQKRDNTTSSHDPIPHLQHDSTRPRCGDRPHFHRTIITIKNNNATHANYSCTHMIHAKRVSQQRFPISYSKHTQFNTPLINCKKTHCIVLQFNKRRRFLWKCEEISFKTILTASWQRWCGCVENLWDALKF